MEDVRPAHLSLANSIPIDLRQSSLYQEAEEIVRSVFQPGSGRPTGAMEAVVSPDGRQVAFTGTTLEKLQGTPATRICMADLASGALRVVSFGPNGDMTPKFSSDGLFLAFRSDRAAIGNFQVYLLDLHSGATRAAPQVDGWVESLEFSPDGTRLLLVVAGFGADTAAVHGAKTTERADASESAAWMPSVETGDETFRRRSAWTIDVREGSAKRVSPDPLNVWEACWCGNDTIAAVVTAGSSEGAWYRAYLVSISLADGKANVLYRPKDQLGWLSGSPDGRRLAVVEAVCSDRGLCAGDVLIVETYGGTVRPIQSLDIDATTTRWRDDRHVLIAGIRDLETVVAEIDIASGKSRELWRSEELYSPSPHYPQVTPCGREGFILPVHGHLISSRLLHVGSSNARTVVNFGHEGTERFVHKLRAVRPYRWQARDGQEIQGWLMPGLGKKPASLVMEVHGGPIWRSSPFFLGQAAYYAMLAERGYAMFWPNPRGSSGRGQAFARAVAGDMGGADARDCLSGLDDLVAEGIAHPEGIGVMGHSYGGYMTAWLITQDQRFAAAIASAPITDWVSQHLTSNIPDFDSLFLLSRYTESGGSYHGRSPVMFAHRVKTPTMSVCGALDRCAPVGQAREFHNALVENGVESVLVTYPREGHGVRSLPAMIDYSARVVDWFTKHLPVM